ncbi:uncharacterized protein LOC116934643 [Daphnia magna]|uniref:uncharacterized protein LOC116934643 n=1 Tax=Daphnia magna TaxID=35525 RepID=UPI001E1BCC76|nr:uncharacterized protein LOC116934643 [Daphnia magna]
MSSLPFLLLLCFYGLHPQAFETTVCDCSEPKNMGIIQFSDSNCKPETNNTDTVQVKYTVYSDERAAVKFPGFICAQWINIRRITKTFFGQLVIVPDKISIDTTPTECYDMINNKRCGEHHMTLSDNKYVFGRDPEIVGYWLQTIDSEILNCVLEQVQLYQQMEDEDFSTPIGKASAKSGNLSHNHLTLVWDKTYTQKSQHTLRIVESGTGTLTKKLGDEKYFRLLDDRRQLDFHLTPQPPCVPTQQHCSNRTTVFNIVGQSKLSLVTAAIMEKFPPITVETPAPSSAEDLDKAANKQYIQDRVTDRENELVRMIQRLECDARKAKHERAIAAAQYNGWLAASHLKLPQCTKLQAFGQTAVVVKCNSVNVTFETVITSCGPQPKFNIYTINLDGWELVKYSPCYWTNGFVNFNDKPYAFRNNTWKRVDANMVLPEQTLAHSFRYDDVKFFDYEHRTNPAYNDNLLNHMNVMADIVAAMNEHPPTEFSLNHQPSASSVLVTAAGVIHYTSWWETIKMWFFISIFCILGLVILRICCWLGIFRFIRKFCGYPIEEARSTTTNRTAMHPV